MRLSTIGILMAMILASGCTLGVRKETHIVYASIAKTPDNVKGLVRIATNEPIPVTIGEENVSNLDLGGYYVVSASDLQTLLQGLKSQEGE